MHHPASDDRRTDSLLERARPFLEKHPHALVVMDDRGRIAFANEATETLFGYQPRELLGQEVELLLPERHRDKHRAQCRAYLGRPQALAGTGRRLVGRKRDGTEFPVEIGLNPLPTDSGLLVIAALVDMSGRLDAEKAVREIEAQYQSLAEGLPLNVFRKDRQGRFIYANRRCCELMHSALQDLVGRTDFDLFPRELAEKYRRDDRHVIETGEIFEDIEEYHEPGRAKSFVHVLKAPVRNAAGEIVGVQGMFWDVSARMRAEEGLRESEVRKQAVFDAALDCMLVVDADGRVTEFNRAAEKAFGYQRGEVIGREMSELLFPRSSRVRHQENLERYVATGEEGSLLGRRIELELVRKNGETFAAEMAMQPIPLEGAPGFTVVLRDITDRKRGQEALEQERYLLHSLLDNIPDNIYFKDEQGRFLRINSAKAHRSGLTDPSEAVGKSDFDFFPDEHARRAADDERRVMDTGEPLVGKEERLVWPDGKVSWVSTTKVPLRDREDRIVGTFGISRDISRLKEAEEALREAKETAEAASRAKSDFLANMSHEIRTPLNAIIGMTELVLDTQLTAAQREYLRTVFASGEALLELINDILDFSKIEAGKLDLERTQFDLRESVGDTMKSLALRAHREELELAFHVAPDVPEVLAGDPARLRQVLVNLIGNAIKFTEEGEVVLDVSREIDPPPSQGGAGGGSAAESGSRSSTRTSGGSAVAASAQSLSAPNADADRVRLRFSVRDTGIGIAPDKLGVIFEAFEQADTSMTRRYGGTGLGLAISSRLVELMGGKIEVESEVGNGSTFHFTAEFEAPKSSASAARRWKQPHLAGMRVLVADDNGTNRLILEEMLRNWGMAPATAPSARAALAELRRAHAADAPYTLVLSDVNMPESDGFRLVEWIRQDPDLSSTVIMMLTSGGRTGDVARCEALGAASYLIKPVKQSELFDAIAVALDIDRPEKVAAGEPGAAECVRPLRVLLAEDSLPNQKLAIGLLERWGHAVTVANDGQAAVEAVEAADRAGVPFDLVLMDVQMPEMDGLAATQRIRRHERRTGRRTPIIAMTAHAMKGDREQCLDAGMDDYISKPVRARALLEKIEPLIRAPEPAKAPRRALPLAGAGVVDWPLALDAVDGDRDLLRDVAAAFLEEAPGLLQMLRRGLDENDAELVRRAAHTLAGAMRTFGAPAAVERTRALEAAGRAKELAGLREPLDGLDREVAALAAELAAFVSPAGAPAGSGGAPPQAGAAT
ncbi:MAG: PAS domain S-box protein [Planctomycetales bacterium]